MKVTFSWRKLYRDIGTVIIAVSRAIASGHNTKDTLLNALPQFSENRIALALGALFTSDMLENHLGTLTVHRDMNIVFELLKGEYILPMLYSDIIQSEDDRRLKPEIGRCMIYKFGCKNPSGVELLIQISIQDNKNE
ncbi:hypothetical protein EII21_01020 [Conchiformibius steedae]|uniref:Uncharacterized protein n=1 Tax=Conchiformibius steedae TaxID=153493 RepID=A0A3P2A8R5_9NEIS|nr:hypothetical protein EII21_01020 [Conchiformibius steedae]